MEHMTRRHALKASLIGFGALTAHSLTSAFARGQSTEIRFTLDLSCGSIGVQADQLAAIELAHKHGFESVTPRPDYLATLTGGQLEELVASLKAKQLKWGAAGLPVDFRSSEQAFQADLEKLPRLARAMRAAGVTRVGTWLSPQHDELTYVANFRQHSRRLRECAKVLRDEDQRLGFEYVGPKTLWASSRYSFIHSMAETKELNSEIGLDNVGIVLDSWHWYTAQETADDLRTLTNRDVVACDLNDAPQRVPVDQQMDNRRELPASTGVIDLKTFLGVLVEIGYDGPVRAEPFNKTLNAMEDDRAVAATANALRRAFDLVRT